MAHFAFFSDKGRRLLTLSSNGLAYYSAFIVLFVSFFKGLGPEMRLLNRWNGYEEKVFFFQNFFFRQKEKKKRKKKKKKKI